MLLQPLSRIRRGREDVVISNRGWSRDDEEEGSDDLHDVVVVQERASFLAEGEVVEGCAQEGDLEEVGVDVHLVRSGEGLQRGAAVEGARVDGGISWHVD